MEKQNIVWDLKEKPQRELASYVIFEYEDFHKVRPTTKDFKKANEIKLQIENSSQDGKEAAIYLVGDAKSLEWYRPSSVSSVEKVLPVESAKLSLNVQERAALLAVLGIYPKSDLHRQDRVVFDRQSHRLREGEIDEVIHNIIKIKDMKDVYYHEWIVGLVATGNLPFLLITIGRDYSKLENRLPSVTERFARKVSHSLSKLIP